jgi:hypothetical protein
MIVAYFEHFSIFFGRMGQGEALAQNFSEVKYDGKY